MPEGGIKGAVVKEVEERLGEEEVRLKVWGEVG